MATEQLSAGPDNNSEENPKPSLLKKVKAKAKKLKSKIKHNSSDDSHSTSAGVANEDGSPDHHGYDSSSDVSSGDEAVHVVDGVPYTPLSNLVHNHRPAKSSEGNSNGTDPGNEYPAATNPAAFKNRGPTDSQQAVPTTYHYFNEDLETARLPSEYGADSVPLSHPVEKLTKEGILDSQPKDNNGGELDKEAGIKSSETFDIDTGVRGLNTQSDDRLLSGSVEQDKGVGIPGASSFGILTPSKSVEDKSGETRNSQAGQQGVPTASPRNALTPANSLQGSEFPAGGHSDTSFLEQVKETVTNSSTSSAEEVNPSENVTTAGEGGVAESASWKPIHHRAYEGLAAAAVGATGLAVAGGEKLGLYKSDSTAPAKDKHNQGSSTIYSSESAEKDIASPVGEGVGKNSDYYLNEASTTTHPSSAKSETAGAPGEDQPWSRKAYNAIFGAKGNGAEKLPPGNSNGSTTETNGSTIPGGEVHRPVERGHSDHNGSTNSNVVSEKSDENLKTSDSAGKALSSDSRSVLQGASEAAPQATRFSTQATTPDHHDKALASSITESISNLPSLLTSKLGFGGSSTGAAASPNGSKSGASDFKEPHVSTNTSANTNTGSETTTPDEGPTAPGILDRMSGVASSLFGGVKIPVTAAATTDEPSSGKKA